MVSNRLLPASCVCLISLVAAPTVLPAQDDGSSPTLRVAPLTGELRLDGRLDEAVWARVDSIGSLTMTEPVEG